MNTITSSDGGIYSLTRFTLTDDGGTTYFNIKGGGGGIVYSTYSSFYFTNTEFYYITSSGYGGIFHTDIDSDQLYTFTAIIFLEITAFGGGIGYD